MSSASVSMPVMLAALLLLLGRFCMWMQRRSLRPVRCLTLLSATFGGVGPWPDLLFVLRETVRVSVHVSFWL